MIRRLVLRFDLGILQTAAQADSSTAGECRDSCVMQSCSMPAVPERGENGSTRGIASIGQTPW
jgi:hypothetical protein